MLIGWLSLITISASIRFLIFNAYHRKKPEGKALLSWEKPFFYSLMFSSLIWGVGAVVIMPENSKLHQAAIYIFLVGMAGGAMSVYMARRKIVMYVISLILLPSTLWFILQSDFTFLAIVLGALLFFFSSIRATKIINDTLQQNFLLNEELTHAKQRAEQQARIDELTGIENRRAFYEIGHKLLSQARREEKELVTVLLDIDLFKEINDQYGHAAGDVTLKRVTKIIRQRLRESDVFARIGGEEFAIMLPATSSKQALQLVEELRQSIEEAQIHFKDTQFSVTVSFGISVGNQGLDILLRQADIALYKSKTTGRNKVSIADPDPGDLSLLQTG
ncbi:MAG: GGDEF domain-containing protein [Proteobacteria bacterium]|nr:GGDEF domain-containing protein [Pseudomonadota bacterium]